MLKKERSYFLAENGTFVIFLDLMSCLIPTPSPLQRARKGRGSMKNERQNWPTTSFWASLQENVCIRSSGVSDKHWIFKILPRQRPDLWDFSVCIYPSAAAPNYLAYLNLPRNNFKCWQLWLGGVPAYTSQSPSALEVFDMNLSSGDHLRADSNVNVRSKRPLV